MGPTSLNETVLLVLYYGISQPDEARTNALYRRVLVRECELVILLACCYQMGDTGSLLLVAFDDLDRI
jgi:hypothetical protein